MSQTLTAQKEYSQKINSLSNAPLHDDVADLQKKLEGQIKAETEQTKTGFSQQTANNQNPYTYVEVTPTIKSDVSDMLSSLCDVVKSTAIQFTKDPGAVIHNILILPEKIIKNDAMSIFYGVVDMIQAFGYAKDGDYEMAGKEFLSGLTNFVGGTTSLALVATIVLAAINPAAAVVLAKATLFGGVVEMGLGSTQVGVGITTNDSDYTKEGIGHMIGGGLKAFSAKQTLKTVQAKIAESNAIKVAEQEIAQQSRLLEQVDDIVEDSGSELVFKSGKAGEEYLAELVGGESQVYYKTSYGGRYIDQLADGIAYESKVGYKTLTEFTKNQILKDAELIEQGVVKSANWNFFKSNVTGRVGASKPLIEFLEKLGITYTIHN